MNDHEALGLVQGVGYSLLTYDKLEDTPQNRIKVYESMLKLDYQDKTKQIIKNEIAFLQRQLKRDEEAKSGFAKGIVIEVTAGQYVEETIIRELVYRNLIDNPHNRLEVLKSYREVLTQAEYFLGYVDSRIDDLEKAVSDRKASRG